MFGSLGDVGKGPLRFLLVEDDPDNRYLLVRTLEGVYRDKAELLAVGSLREAEAALRAESFGCVILDLTLGDASGTAGLESLRAIADVPIVVLTGRSELGVKALERGANAFLEKNEMDTARVALCIEDAMTSVAGGRERSHLAAIVQSSRLAMFLRDVNGTILTWNPGAEEVFGYTRDEIIGRDCMMLIPSDCLEREQAFSELVFAGQSVPRYESQRLRKDGSIVDVGVTLAATHGPDGEISGISVIARDITREKQTQRERDLLSGIVNSALGAIVSTDNEGRITSWNTGAERLFGYEAGEVIGQPTAFLLPPKLNDGTEQLVERRMHGEPIDAVETVRRRKDGSLIDVVITGNEIHDSGGNVIGIAAIYHDMTDRKTAEKELERRGGLLAEAQRIAAIGSWDLDVETNLVEWSDEMFRLFGYEPGSISPRLETMLDAVHPDDKPLVLSTLDRVISEKESAAVEMRISLPDGTSATLSVRGQAIVSDDGRLHVVGTAQDITERKRLEEQLLQSQKMEALGGLAGGIAHDFNNLLAVILNYGHFIAQDLPEGSRMREDIESVIQAAERGSGLVKQLLAFSRKEVVRPEVVNLNVLISQMQPLLRRLVRESIDLEEHLAPDTWDTTADRGQLEQVLLNLFVNARDAMPSGGKIIVSTSNVIADEAFAGSHPDFRPGRFACMTVSDTGSGMTRQTQERIFEPFFTTKPMGGGTGLGLATVYGIVKRSGGFISVYSEVGLGTTFKIYLPATFVIQEEADFEPIQLSMTGRGERIVVVEDDGSVLALIGRILSDNHYDVVPLDSPDEALTRLQQDRDVALLLTDVVMPQMSGRSLSEAADIPTVFMSGYTDSIIEQQGVLQEGVIFLPKPFTSEELLSVVRSAIDERGRAGRAVAKEEVSPHLP